MGKWAVTKNVFILLRNVKKHKKQVSASCFKCCNTTFSQAAYDALAAEQLFFHNRGADFVYVTVGVIESLVEHCSQI